LWRLLYLIDGIYAGGNRKETEPRKITLMRKQMPEKKERIYLSPPHMGGEEVNFVGEAFDKNWIAPLGPNVNGFEQDLENYTGRKHAAVVTSGTAAIHLALILNGVGPGDEVICQSFTFTATANPVRYQGAIPVFIDSEPETWNMDPQLLEKAILEREKRPKAILVVHLYGMPAKMAEIMQVAEKYDIPVIEDAAEALGSSIRNRNCGTYGSLSVLSFNGNKIITTSGGGALLSDDEKTIQKARFLATQARDDAPHYQHSELGYNYRMSNIVAGVGRGQMKVVDQRVQRRREIHEYYFKKLGGTYFTVNSEGAAYRVQDVSSTGIYFLKEPKGYVSNRWLTTILVNPAETGGVTREDIRLALEAENIESRPLWKPMHMQPLYREFPYAGSSYNVYWKAGSQSQTSGDEQGISDFLFKYGLCLPSGSAMDEKDLKRITDILYNLLRK